MIGAQTQGVRCKRQRQEHENQVYYFQYLNEKHVARSQVNKLQKLNKKRLIVVVDVPVQPEHGLRVGVHRDDRARVDVVELELLLHLDLPQAYVEHDGARHCFPAVCVVHGEEREAELGVRDVQVLAARERVRREVA